MQNKTLLQKVKKVFTPKKLVEVLGFDFDVVDISYRGGTLGFNSDKIAELVEVDEDLLPTKFGAYCNYLGGGLRGSITFSDFSEDISTQKTNLLNAIGEAIVRCYNFYEDETGLQEEEDENGEPNWENIGSNRSRQADIVSAY